MIILSIILSIIALVASGLYLFVWHYGYLQAWVCMLYVVIAIVNYLANYKNYTIKQKKVFLCIILGLYFGMLGDALLGYKFLIGGVVFALGHVFYIIAFCFAKRFCWKDLIILLFVCGITIALNFIIGFKFGNMLFGMIAYGFALSFMLSKSLSNLIFEKERDIYTITHFVAGLLFYFSDLMLMTYNFAHSEPVFDMLCMLSYMPAQILFATSLAFFKKQKNNE